MSVDSNLDGVSLFRNGDGKYVQREIQAAWLGWQAALASNKAAAVAVPGEEYQVKSDPIMCWETYQDRAVVQKHFDQLKADGCNAQFRVIYTAPIASAEEAVPIAWRYLTPTGWHATTKMDKALGASAHHDMEPLYTHPAAAQPSRAEVLTLRHDQEFAISRAVAGQELAKMDIEALQDLLADRGSEQS
jgi:hypothetical protein